MGIKEHCMMEFKAAGWLEEPVDEMQQLVMDNLMELVDVFAEQGHSGFSANYVINALNKLLRYEPLGPLTGEDWEWAEVGDKVYQNKRCGRVFKQPDRYDGKPYDIDGKVFVEKHIDENGEPYESCYTSKDSPVAIEFPYTPKTEYVYVDGESK